MYIIENIQEPLVFKQFVNNKVELTMLVMRLCLLCVGGLVRGPLKEIML